MTKQKFVYEELPLSALSIHRSHTDLFFSPTRDEDDRGLLESIAQYGIRSLIIVSAMEEEGYVIVDGRRRYLAAKALGLATVPCCVHPKLSEGEYELIRFATNDKSQVGRQAGKRAATKKRKAQVRSGK